MWKSLVKWVGGEGGTQDHHTEKQKGRTRESLEVGLREAELNFNLGPVHVNPLLLILSACLSTSQSVHSFINQLRISISIDIFLKLYTYHIHMFILYLSNLFNLYHVIHIYMKNF